MSGERKIRESMDSIIEEIVASRRRYLFGDTAAGDGDDIDLRTRIAGAFAPPPPELELDAAWLDAYHALSPELQTLVRQLVLALGLGRRP